MPFDVLICAMGTVLEIAEYGGTIPCISCGFNLKHGKKAASGSRGGGKGCRKMLNKHVPTAVLALPCPLGRLYLETIPCSKAGGTFWP